jgi:hypothetical protein
MGPGVAVATLSRSRPLRGRASNRPGRSREALSPLGPSHRPWAAADCRTQSKEPPCSLSRISNAQPPLCAR